MKLVLTAILGIVLITASACGGGAKSSSSGGTSAAPSSGAVTLGAGSTVTGIDINVTSGSPPMNALVLGVADITSTGGSASNTGASVQRGTQAQVLMFGPGLNGQVQVALSGPGDIGISNIQSITSTKGTPGVEFVITVPGSAAVGARTVFLTDANGNVTTFTGGLEVQ